MTAPLVSVVIPAYNAAGFIEKTLDTVARQTYRSFEVIVVDDGSSDDTAQVVEAFLAKRQLAGQCIRQPNKKIAAARNAGMKAARGTYIALLDHDDLWFPDKLETVMKEFERHPDADLICHNENIVKDGALVRVSRNGPASREMYRRLLFNGNALSPSASVFKRAAALAIGGFRENPEFNTVEDYDFWMRLSRTGRYRFIDKVLGEYQLVERAASRRIEYHHTNLEHMLRDHLRALLGERPGALARARIRKRLSAVYRSAAGQLMQFGESPAEQRRYVFKMLSEWPFDAKNAARAVQWLLGRRPHPQPTSLVSRRIWRVWTDDEARKDWDRELSALGQANLYQSYRWGEAKRLQGQEILRLSTTGALAQCAIKRYPFDVAVAWIAGGPAGDPARVDDSLVTAIKAASGVRRLFCRIRPYIRSNEGLSTTLTQNGWSRSLCPLNTSGTFVLDLTKSQAELEQGLTANWRHNLKRAKERSTPPQPWKSAAPEDVIALLEKMQAFKGLGEQHSASEVSSWLRAFGGDFVLLRCNDERGRPVAARGILIDGGRAYDIIAAATREGREKYCAYALLWQLVLEAKKRGAAAYDLSGADPVRALGVFNFKKGTGAEAIEWAGEWERASSEWLLWGANLMIARKAKR